MPASADRATWLRSDRFLARAVARPVERFLHVEAAGGLVLVVAGVAALVWANSPWSASYESLWHTAVSVDVGGHGPTLDLRHWVNDGLMTLFFFVIGLEIKQEVVDGELNAWRKAAVPVAGAVGGMAVPALLYVAVNAGGAGAGGWGIPMATDVAFALGVLALLGDRVPSQLKVLLLALAIVDDIGAILVIAIFYSEGIEGAWLAGAAALVLGIAGLRRLRVRYLPVYVVLGCGVWLATFESGIHATIAGVALGLLTPARPFLPEVDADRIADELSSDEHVTPREVRGISFRIRESVPTTERLQSALHPWTSFVVVPLFALANAGVSLDASSVGDALASRVTLGVAGGLVVGKLLGVTVAIVAATRSGLGALPEGLGRRHVIALGAVAGIGFTVSIFVAGLAFEDSGATAEAKVGVLLASACAAGVTAAVLRRPGSARGRSPSPSR